MHPAIYMWHKLVREVIKGKCNHKLVKEVKKGKCNEESLESKSVDNRKKTFHT